jgi:glycosyltransferase involved in cell wall biosynthesis
MGRLFETGNADALAAALDEVLADRARFLVPRERIADIFALERTIDAYESVLAGKP